ncbi:MAG: DUF3568 family protein [Candidatus Omnitrophica bacterium]|nr:DUF3568 family protein [Candidatus Omnitrophota bacterium]
MFKKIYLSLLLVGFALTSSGCVAFLAGAGGTVLWQGGKVISEENTTMERAVIATKEAFKAKKITLTDQTIRDTVTQIRGDDSSQTKIAVDVFVTGAKSCRIEVRVGLGEEKAGRELLSQIKKRL